MNLRVRLSSLFFVAFLFSGIAMPLTGRTHWEGFEAADPSTPTALLAFDSAIARYTSLDSEVRSWRGRFGSNTLSVGGLRDSGSHLNNAAVVPVMPATMQR